MTLLANILGSTNADMIGNDANSTFTIKNTSTGAALTLANGAAATSGATIAPLTLIASTASQAVLTIQGVFISTASINASQGQSAFVIPVYHQTQGVFGYISASKGVA